MKKDTKADSKSTQKDVKFIDGYQVPKFVPFGRGLLVPSMDHVIIQEDELESDELLETEKELTEKDFQTTVIRKGPLVDSFIEEGDKVQILPNGPQWFTKLEIEGQNYFLIKESVIIGKFV